MLKVQAKTLGTVAIVRLEGQVVNGETDILRSVMHSVAGASVVRLDLARVTTVDARGLGAMLELREQAGTKGMRFELMNVTQRIKMLLELTRLDSVFQIATGVEFFSTVSFGQRASMTAPA